MPYLLREDEKPQPAGQASRFTLDSTTQTQAAKQEAAEILDHEQQVRMGATKRRGNLAPYISLAREEAARRLKDEGGLLLEEGRVAAGKRQGRNIARAVERNVRGIPGVGDAFYEFAGNQLGAFAGSLSGILTAVDRIFVEGGKSGADLMAHQIALDTGVTKRPMPEQPLGPAGALDEQAAQQQGMAEQFSEQTDLPRLIYDVGQGFNSLATSYALGYGGGRYLGGPILATYYGLSQGGNDAIKMENILDPVTGKPLATPQQVKAKILSDAVISGVLEKKGVDILKGTAHLPGAGKAVEYGKRVLGSMVSRWGEMAAGEAVTEQLQSLASSVITNTIDPNADWLDSEDVADSFYSGLIGFITGGGSGAIEVFRQGRLEAALKAAKNQEVYDEVLKGEAEKQRSLLATLTDPNALMEDQEAAIADIIGVTKQQFTAQLDAEANDFMTGLRQANTVPVMEAFSKPRRMVREKREPAIGVERPEGFITDLNQLGKVEIKGHEVFSDSIKGGSLAVKQEGGTKTETEPARIIERLRETLPEGAEDDDVGKLYHVTTNLPAVQSGGTKSRAQLRKDFESRKRQEHPELFEDEAADEQSVADVSGERLRERIRKRKLREGILAEGEGSALGGGSEDVAPNKVSVTYWRGRADIIERDLKYLADEVVTGNATPNQVIDTMAQNWGVYDLNELGANSATARILGRELGKKFPDSGIEDIVDRVMDGNVEDDSDYEIFDQALADAYTTPEEKYELYQLIEGAMVADSNMREGGMRNASALVTAPWSSIKNLRSENIGIVEMAARRESSAELVEGEQELRFAPEDIVVLPSKEAIQAGRIPLRSRGFLKPTDIRVKRNKDPQVKNQEIWEVNGREYYVQRTSATGRRQFTAYDAETQDAIAEGRDKKDVERQLQELTVESIQAGGEVANQESFTDFRTFRKLTIERAKQKAEQAKGWINLKGKDGRKAYLAAQARNPRKATLTPYTDEDLKKASIFKHPVKEAYFLLIPKQDEQGNKSHDVAGLFANESKANAIEWAISTALANTPEGVPLTLDAFAGFLDKRYADEGFVEHERLPFDPKYSTPEQMASLREEKYYKETGKYPDVVFMHHKTRPFAGQMAESKRAALEDADLDQAEASAMGEPARIRRTEADFFEGLRDFAPTPEDTAELLQTMHEAALDRQVQEMIDATRNAKTITGKFASAPKAGSRIRRRKVPPLPALHESREIGRAESYMLYHERPVYLFERMQGDKAKGPFTAIFHDPFVVANALYQDNFHSERGLVGKLDRLIKGFGGQRSFAKKFLARGAREGDPEGIQLTGQERIGIALALLDGDAARKLDSVGMTLQNGADTRPITLKEQREVARNLTRGEKAIVAFLTAHWNAQFQAMQVVATGLGKPLAKRAFYYPNTGKETYTVEGSKFMKNPAEVLGTIKTKQDFAANVLQDWFTQERGESDSQRINVAAIDVFLRQGKAVEYWIAHALPLAQALEVANNKTFRDSMNQAFGRAAGDSRSAGLFTTSPLKVIDAVLRDIGRNSVANTSSGEEWLATLRRHSAVALLGLKVGVMLKQPISIVTGLAEYAMMGQSMGTNPVYLMAKMGANALTGSMPRAIASAVFGRKGDAITQAIEQMPILRSREQGEGIDPEVDLMIRLVRDKNIERRLKGDGTVRINGFIWKEKAAKMAMQGIIQMDRVAIRTMADAIVRMEVANGSSIEHAVEVAQRAIEKTQPMSGTQYLPLIFRSGEFNRMLMMFTGELNQAGNLVFQSFRKAFPHMGDGDDEKRKIAAFIAVIMAGLVGNYISSFIDSAGRTADPTKKESLGFYTQNAARYYGQGLGGIFGGLASQMLVNQFYYDGAFGDAPTSPGIQAAQKAVETAGRISRKSSFSEEDLIRLTRDIGGLSGIAAELPIQGAVNFAIGWFDAINDGVVTPAEMSAILGLSRFARGEQGKANKKGGSAPVVTTF